MIICFISSVENISIVRQIFQFFINFRFQHVRRRRQRLHRPDRDDEDRQVDLQHDGTKPGKMRLTFHRILRKTNKQTKLNLQIE